jgi:hypothetical protein
MDNALEKTNVLVEASEREIKTKWSEILGIHKGKVLYKKEKQPFASIILFSTNLKNREIFRYPIPKTKAIQLGKIDLIHNQFNQRIVHIPQLECDPGNYIGNAGIIVWRNKNDSSLFWSGYNIYILSDNSWSYIDRMETSMLISSKSRRRGLLSPWWGFIIKNI